MMSKSVFKYCGPQQSIIQAYEFQVVNPYAGSIFCSRTYNSVTNESLVFRIASNGDGKGLQDLVASLKLCKVDSNI